MKISKLLLSCCLIIYINIHHSSGSIPSDNLIAKKWSTLQNHNTQFSSDNTQKVLQEYIGEDRSKIANNPQNISKNADQGSKMPAKPLRRRLYIPFSFRALPQNKTHEECLASSSEDFPEDVFTMEQKRNGAVILHFILGIYCFTLLAVVCNDYFLPSVELICEKLHLSQDVAAATFMAIATSAPEFFVNLVGTFVTHSDIGVGTIVGSAMFNTLGVAALGGLAASTPIKIDWWPITRDSIIYICTVTMLVGMCKDEEIQWYESLTLLIFYIMYFILMWANKPIYEFIVRLVDKLKKRSRLSNEHGSTGTFSSLATFGISGNLQDAKSDSFLKGSDISVIKINPDHDVVSVAASEEEESMHLLVWPRGNQARQAWWIFSWPVRLLLTLTVPDCRRHPRLFPLTFIMCVVWIGFNSYVVSWMITIIGSVLHIPDFVMGITFLAAGGCLPEAISIFIVSRKGHGGMGVSNSLGANTLDILLCLGLPWFIKSMIGISSGKSSYIPMGSDSLFYTIIALILAVLVLYLTISFSGYRLNRKVGIILFISYIFFLTMAIVFEMYLLTEGNLKPCPT